MGEFVKFAAVSIISYRLKQNGLNLALIIQFVHRILITISRRQSKYPPVLEQTAV